MEVARRLVVQRNLLPVAFGHLTADALVILPFDALDPTKALLGRFFSAEAWTDADARALAEAVGPGEGWWSRPLDDEVTLEYGWRDGRFTILLSSATLPLAAAIDEPTPVTPDGLVVLEATADPRTIRFRIGPIHDDESSWFESPASAHGYWRGARLFDEFPEVANVVIGPDFMEVSLRRASDWERLLGHVQAAVAGVFEGAEPALETRRTQDPRTSGDRRRSAASSSRATRLAHVWAELRPLRPADAGDLETLITASHAEDPFRRQVAASLLLEADPAVAAKHWERLLADPSRAVRRATADAMANAGRDELRPLLERALGDSDRWVRQTAVHGLVELGPEPSRDAIAALAGDPDFRVRLEVAAFLQASGPAT
ncbi:MAG: HEAT repeat domain-containing protein [Actinomycetota bacterium]|nr:HEAT repeat domain-containing protein [Actinomycetota bacterium]